MRFVPDKHEARQICSRSVGCESSLSSTAAYWLIKFRLLRERGSAFHAYPTVASPREGATVGVCNLRNLSPLNSLLLYWTGAGTLSAAQYTCKIALATQGVELVPAQRTVDQVRLGDCNSSSRSRLQM